MPRPIEYDNLIKTGAFEAVATTPGAAQSYLGNASDYLDAAQNAGRSMKPLQVFTLAYEGFYALVQATLEHREVRTKDSGRNLAIQRVAHDLGLSPPEFAAVVRAHARRNDTSYKSPFPPVSHAEALAMTGILAKSLPAAQALLTPLPPPAP
jgi:hypothetical protein